MFLALNNKKYLKVSKKNYISVLSPGRELSDPSGEIKKYAEVNAAHDLTELFLDITKLLKGVKDEIYRLLVKEFGYFA